MREMKLTEGNVLKNLVRFSLPFLLSCFLQTFYGLADLFIAGQYNGASTITAVSIGSQVMHMFTVIIVGLAMGTTVAIGHSVGAKDENKVKKIIGNTYMVFFIFAVALTIILWLSANGVIHLLSTPEEAFVETREYVLICVGGIIFITAYNVVSSIFRGLGDSKTPMIFVGISGVINIVLDYLLIGPGQMGARGAAIATVVAQGLSVIMALIYAVNKVDYFKIGKVDCKLDKAIVLWIIKVGVPVAAQDGFIQISFLVITVIANMRGVDAAAGVGIVEKLISFMFLVPSALLSAVSAITAQNVGAGNHKRSRQTLWYAIAICEISGLFFFVVCNLWAEGILGLFTKQEPAVILLGAQYLRAYVIDCMIAGIHFCFSGYFCAYEKSYLSFLHNLVSVLLVRIPGAYLAMIYYPDTLYPMGLAAPSGSFLSVIICVVAFVLLYRKGVLVEKV